MFLQEGADKSLEEPASCQGSAFSPYRAVHEREWSRARWPTFPCPRAEVSDVSLSSAAKRRGEEAVPAGDWGDSTSSTSTSGEESGVNFPRGKNRNVREQKFQNKVCLGRTPQLARGRWEIKSCGQDSWCWSQTFTQLCITHTCNPWTLCIILWLVSLCQTWHWVQ